MIDAHDHGSGDTLYELGRIVLFFGLLGIGLWIFLKLMLRSYRRGSRNGHIGVNRHRRRTERVKRKRKNNPR